MVSGQLSYHISWSNKVTVTHTHTQLVLILYSTLPNIYFDAKEWDYYYDKPDLEVCGSLDWFVRRVWKGGALGYPTPPPLINCQDITV